MSLKKCRNEECQDKKPRWCEKKTVSIWDEVDETGEFIRENASKIHDSGWYECLHCGQLLEFEEADLAGDEDPRAMGLNNG